MMAGDRTMRILIADDDMVSRRALEVTMVKFGYEVIIAGDGGEALAVLQSADAPPIAILDWIMPVYDGIEVCRKIREITTSTPPYIILLTAKSEKTDVVKGLEAGADDYLTKPFERSELIARIHVGSRLINLQRKLADRIEELDLALSQLRESERQIRDLSMTDELTGLYNRRGFLVLAEGQQKMARRTNLSFSLIFADMDGLKKINDTFGHQEGSEAIRQTAQILKSCFRETDIIGRFGGDEFAIFVADSAGCAEIPMERLKDNLRQFNRQNPHDYKLSLSLGMISVHGQDDCSIEALLSKADNAMYENKKSKKNNGRRPINSIPQLFLPHITESAERMVKGE